MHVGTPTLNVNAPPFPPNLHQAPLPPHANRPNNFYTNVPNANTPSHTFNTHVPQKQWEWQEKLDMECNQMEKEKEERKRMKEECKQRKED